MTEAMADNSMYYDMPPQLTGNAKLGKCLIISNDKFDKRTGHSIRRGAKVDLKNLVKLFESLGFNVEKHENLTRVDVRKVLQKVAREDHSKSSCFACCVLTHGREGYISAYDEEIKLNEVFVNFEWDNCPTLRDKPKLFFIQACRGQSLDDGVWMDDRVRSVDQCDSGHSTSAEPIFPTEPDFLVAYSTVSDYASWRNIDEGSWFIQALCQVLHSKSHQKDLLSLLAEVNRRVAYGFQSFDAESSRSSGKKQMPCFISTLTKNIRFPPSK